MGIYYFRPSSGSTISGGSYTLPDDITVDNILVRENSTVQGMSIIGVNDITPELFRNNSLIITERGLDLTELALGFSNPEIHTAFGVGNENNFYGLMETTSLPWDPTVSGVMLLSFGHLAEDPSYSFLFESLPSFIEMRGPANWLDNRTPYPTTIYVSCQDPDLGFSGYFVQNTHEDQSSAEDWSMLTGSGLRMGHSLAYQAIPGIWGSWYEYWSELTPYKLMILDPSRGYGTWVDSIQISITDLTVDGPVEDSDGLYLRRTYVKQFSGTANNELNASSLTFNFDDGSDLRLAEYKNTNINIFGYNYGTDEEQDFIASPNGIMMYDTMGTASIYTDYMALSNVNGFAFEFDPETGIYFYDNDGDKSTYAPEGVYFPDTSFIGGAPKGSTAFNEGTGVEITHSLNDSDHMMIITPTSDPGAGFYYWVTKGDNSDIVYTITGCTTGFDWMAIKTRKEAPQS